MSMRKRWMLFLLTVVSAMLLAAGCGGAKDVADPAEAEQEADGAVAEEEEAQGGPKTDVLELQEVLIDHEVCRVTLDEISFGDHMSLDRKDFTYKMTFENKSDKTICMDQEAFTLNGILGDGSLDPAEGGTISFSGYEIPAGGSREGVGFLAADPLLYGISDIQDITKLEFNISASDVDAQGGEYLMNERLTYYPQGEEKAQDYIPEGLADGQVVMDTENFKATVLKHGMEEDPIRGANDMKYYVRLFMEYKKDEPTDILTREIIFNDVAKNDLMSAGFRVLPWKCNMYLDIYCQKDVLDQAGVTEVEKASFDLHQSSVPVVTVSIDLKQ